MRASIQTLSGGVLAAGLLVASPASADPRGPNSFPVELDCDDGSSYSVVVGGRGTFGVAHDTASNTTLIPTMFGEFTGVVLQNGVVIEEFTDPPMYKGSSTKPRRTSVTCTYEFHDQFEDPELGLLEFHGAGSVTGFVTPAR
jgi:hypothetical protein